MMQWNCPHCGTKLATSQDDLGTGWSFSKCAHCTGYSLIRKTEINVIRVDKAPPGERIIASQYSARTITESPHPTSNTESLSPQISPPTAHSILATSTLPSNPSDLAKHLNEKIHRQPTPPPFNSPVSEKREERTDSHFNESPHLVNSNSSPLNKKTPAEPTLLRDFKNPFPSHSPQYEPARDSIPSSLPAMEETKTLSEITFNISGTAFPEREARSFQKPPIQAPKLERTSYRSHTMLALFGILAGSAVILNQRNASLEELTAHEVITDQVKETAQAPVPQTEQSKKWVETQKEMVNAYTGPGMHFPVISQLAPYSLYEVLEIHDSWFKLSLENLPPELKMKSAWVPAQQVHLKN